MLKEHHGSFETGMRLLDALTAVVALPLSVLLYGGSWFDHYNMALMIAFFVTPVVFHFSGVYRPWRSTTVTGELATVYSAWFVTISMLVGVAFLTKTSADFSRAAVILWLLIGFALFTINHLVRCYLLRSLREHGKNTRNAVIVGAGALGLRLSEHIKASPWMGIYIQAYFDDASEGKDVPIAGSVLDVLDYVHKERVDIVYLALPMRCENTLKVLFSGLQDSTTSVYLLPNIFMFDLLHTHVHDVGGIPVLALCDSPFDGFNKLVKRLEDIVLSIGILCLVSPLMLILALAIKITSSGPVFFKQRRYGLNGQEVLVWKFRSMTVCEDDDMRIAQATRHDPRITPLGSWLRRTSMDELPQFINVLQGTMSIVGPRPHAVAHNEEYRKLIQGYMWRHKVKPGVTGWAQVNGWRGETDVLFKMEKRVEHDIWYIQNWSLSLDLRIVWKTIVGELLRKSHNAY